MPGPHSLGQRGSIVDSVAIGLSGLCLAHCLGTAILLAVLASAAGPLLDPRIHEAGLAMAALLAAIALGRGAIQHRQLVPLAAGAAGVLLMAAGLMVPHGSTEIAFTISGVALLALAHLGNRRAG